MTQSPAKRTVCCATAFVAAKVYGVQGVSDTPMDCQAPVALWLIGNEGLDFVSSATMA
jgi:hypothetical protein